MHKPLIPARLIITGIIVLLRITNVCGQATDSSRFNSPVEIANSNIEKLTQIIQQATQLNTEADNGLEIDGLLMDETRTKAGRDFYELFFKAWEAPKQASGYTIRISERPAKGMLTEIIIKVNDEAVYNSWLQARYDLIESTAQWALQEVFRYISHYEEIQRQMAVEDLQGTGIY